MYNETIQPPNPDTKQRPVVIVTGASGLIGSRVCKTLSCDFTIYALDIAEPKDTDSECVRYIETDLTEDESVQSTLKQIEEEAGTHVASVLHLAAYYDFSGDDSPMYEKLTVGGTRRLLTMLQKCGFSVEQFVFTSSLLVMQPQDPPKHISELSDVNPKWAYPQSKIEAENAIKECRGNISTVILRIAGVYDEQCHSLPISQQMARIYEKQMESYVYPGDASHGQALVHLDDLVDCFRRVVEHRRSLPPEEMFLVAEPDVVSYGELQDKIGEQLHGTEWPAIRVPKTVAKAGAWVIGKFGSGDEDFIKPWMVDLADDHYSVSIAHARSKLGWDPPHRLRDTIQAMTEFLQQHPDEFYEMHGLKHEEAAAQ